MYLISSKNWFLKIALSHILKICWKQKTYQIDKAYFPNTWKDKYIFFFIPTFHNTSYYSKSWSSNVLSQIGNNIWTSIFSQKKKSGKSARKKKETSVYYMILQNYECH